MSRISDFLLMYSTVLFTAPNLESSRRICKKLLESKLVACANIFPIDSMYWWKGEILEEKEYAILLKARTQDFEGIKKAILNNHPYQISCIVRYEIAEGHTQYLEWIEESTRRS
ncbi:MAG: divalent-cation tolerance protein CutA [Methanomassiliicoccales archaeon]|nr:divalent-cation tolerance protein CutA [Methanomassiliicoccales archaeon]